MPKHLTNNEARLLALSKRASYADGSPVRKHEEKPPEPEQQTAFPAAQAVDMTPVVDALRDLIEKMPAMADKPNTPPISVEFTVTEWTDSGRIKKFTVNEKS